ncbi:hypothetical protein [Streptococcus parauberis]|uniref:Uncharacterized protein n=1 Tax=Streptococcus parauberis NCFD 2020 TaxID=873447 RepID=F1YWZ8_9STRE|nr:hypothetical protein [Streptococcus parauberis]EGE53334.1 hypothetical protein SPB_0002 [Streptococcus parauberis NCFD 2020]QBX09962.1 hypothetical protein JavanS401_0003 [Streptococcus satellite phage Javan401]
MTTIEQLKKEADKALTLKKLAEVQGKNSKEYQEAKANCDRKFIALRKAQGKTSAKMAGNKLIKQATVKNSFIKK